MFALHLTQKLFSIAIEEWNLFINGSISGSKNNVEDLPGWIPPQCGFDVQNIKVAMPRLYEILQLKEQNLWNNFMNVNNCEMQFPQHCKIGEFQKVLVVQALRPDRLYSAISQCVQHLTGKDTSTFV